MRRRHFIKGMALYTPGLTLPFMAGMGKHFSKPQTQSPPEDGCTPVCEIDQLTAIRRETNFKEWKWPHLNNGNLSIPVDAKTFLNMLIGFAQSTSPTYNGMRVYFASGDQEDNNPSGLPASQAGNLTVIFVPTKSNSLYKPNTGGDDDFSQCWFLYNDVKNNVNINYKLSSDIAHRWIYNYRNNLRGGPGGLNANGAKVIPNFNDTGSMWYNMDRIAGGMYGNQPDCGMIGYIQDGLDPASTNPIDPMMTIGFGAYDKKDESPFCDYYYYIMTQFDFYDKKNKKLFFSMGSTSGQPFIKKRHPLGKNGKPFTNGTTDTGLPCPPADSCNGSISPY